MDQRGQESSTGTSGAVAAVVKAVDPGSRWKKWKDPFGGQSRERQWGKKHGRVEERRPRRRSSEGAPNTSQVIS